MSRMGRISGSVAVVAVVLVMMVLLLLPDGAQEAKKEGDTKKKPPIKRVPIQVDREKRIVDVEAEVCLRQGDWLELLACHKDTKEHESILAIKANPSEVHGALLLIGLKEGSPLRYKKVDGRNVLVPPQGDRIAISLVYKNKDGKEIEVPANEWVVNQKTKKPLKDNIWIFTGSFFDKYKVPKKPGSKEFVIKERYAADLNGTIISLVSFGDDVLSRNSDLTDKTDNQVWGVATKRVPPLRTKVLIRMRPAPKAKGKPDNSKSGKAKTPKK